MEEKEIKSSKSMRGYLIAAIAFVVVLIVVTVSFTFAYFNIETSKTEALNGASASLQCLDISYSETGTIDLDKNYPITDAYALASTQPVTVTVTNNCTSAGNGIDYSLVISSLSKSGSTYISDDKIRTHIKSSVASGTETVLKDTGYLSSLSKLATGSTYDYLMEDFKTRDKVKDYNVTNNYVIKNGTIAPNTVDSYKIYLWVDYYEGDAANYNGGTPNPSAYNNSTENQTFSAAVSLIINSIAETE